MSSELTTHAFLSFTKNGETINFAPGQKRFDVSNDRFTNTIQVIGTTEELLDLGELNGATVTVGWMGLKNLDTTAEISVRLASGASDFMTLEPGEWAIFPFRRVASTGPYVISDTAGANLYVFAVQE